MLVFNYGCMGAGKTLYAINAYEIYKRKGFDPVVIKPAVDNREGEFVGWGETSSRLMPDKKVPCFHFLDLENALIHLDYNTIIVDEAQFLTKEDVNKLAELSDRKNIDIIAYGLKTDVNGNLFEGSSAFIAIADKIKELEALCEAPRCKNKAILHARFINGKRDKNKESIAIEKGDVTYMSVCRKHWKELCD